jgi:hypothetical protein
MDCEFQRISNSLDQNEKLLYFHLPTEGLRVISGASYLFYLPGRKVFFKCFPSPDYSNVKPYIAKMQASFEETFDPKAFLEKRFEKWNDKVLIEESQIPLFLAEKIHGMALLESALAQQCEKNMSAIEKAAPAEFLMHIYRKEKSAITDAASKEALSKEDPSLDRQDKEEEPDNSSFLTELYKNTPIAPVVYTLENQGKDMQSLQLLIGDEFNEYASQLGLSLSV